MKRAFKDYCLIALKGVGMGAADVVPGVSGGTIAFISGIYEELLNSIKAVNYSNLKLLLAGKFKSFWSAVNANFLVALLSGIAFSLLSLAKLMTYLLDYHPILIWSFFFGLIVASAIYVAKDIKQWNLITIVSALLGAFVAYIITTIAPAEPNTSYFFIFISGAIAICAMILPGISGSFILLLLGMYKFIISALSDFKIAVIATFATGAGIGLICFSNVLSWLLKKYFDYTIALLAGFMIGSLNKIWPWKEVVETFVDRHGEIKPLLEQNILPSQHPDSQLFFAFVLACLGFALIFIIEGISNKFKTKA
ncbi:MAG: DUF368 domain-containing protein [Mangrovibacterium sp.]